MKVLYFYSNFSIKFKFHHKGFPQSSQIGRFGGSSGPSRIQNWGQWGRRALWGARWGIVRASSTVSHVSCNYLPLLWIQFSTLKFSCFTIKNISIIFGFDPEPIPFGLTYLKLAYFLLKLGGDISCQFWSEPKNKMK